MASLQGKCCIRWMCWHGKQIWHQVLQTNNGYFTHAAKLGWKPCFVLFFLEISIWASLHCSHLDLLFHCPTTGCFLGCHLKWWGADLRCRSVSWHGTSHSECCEWLPSNPGGGTWRKDVQKHRGRLCSQFQQRNLSCTNIPQIFD